MSTDSCMHWYGCSGVVGVVCRGTTFPSRNNPLELYRTASYLGSNNVNVIFSLMFSTMYVCLNVYYNVNMQCVCKCAKCVCNVCAMCVQLCAMCVQLCFPALCRNPCVANVKCKNRCLFCILFVPVPMLVTYTRNPFLTLCLKPHNDAHNCISPGVLFRLCLFWSKLNQCFPTPQ